MSGEFQTVFGRNLVAELPAFVNRPYLVVTMADLWPRFEGAFDDGSPRSAWSRRSRSASSMA